MNITRVTADQATVTLTPTELHNLNNALNEVCNGLDVPEFATRMGVERCEVAGLLEQIRALTDRMEGM